MFEEVGLVGVADLQLEKLLWSAILAGLWLIIIFNEGNCVPVDLRCCWERAKQLRDIMLHNKIEGYKFAS